MPDITEKFLEGFKEFRRREYEGGKNLMKDLVENGQNPEAAIIACVDSRSGPSRVMDVEVGDSFVSRQIGALVPPYDPSRPADPIAAYIQFAVENKKVKDLIVMGHTQCGGMEALVDGSVGGEVGKWVETAKDIVKKTKGKSACKEDILRETERQSVIWSLKNLMTYPPVRNAMKKGELRIHGWLFDMKNGDMLAYDPTKKKFESQLKLPANTSHKHKHAACECGTGAKRRARLTP